MNLSSYGPDKLNYNSLKEHKFKKEKSPEFDGKLHKKQDNCLESKIVSFYDKLSMEIMVPSQLLLDTGTLNSNSEDKIYAERRLLEITEESKDQIVYIRLIHESSNPQDVLTGKIYFARKLKLIK